MLELVKCTKCGENKPQTEYRKFTRNGKEERRRECRLCENAGRRKRYSKDPEKYKIRQQKYVKENKEEVNATKNVYRDRNRDRINAHHLEWVNGDVNRVKKIWCANSINNHTNRGHNVTITKEELFEITKKSDYCPICGVELKWKQGEGFGPTNPTMDRIDNELDINTNNVWILCAKCNTHKSDKTMKEFIEYCRMVVEKFG